MFRKVSSPGSGVLKEDSLRQDLHLVNFYFVAYGHFYVKNEQNAKKENEKKEGKK